MGGNVGQRSGHVSGHGHRAPPCLSERTDDAVDLENNMEFQLTPAELCQYRKDGYLVRASMFRGFEVEELRQASERVTQRALNCSCQGDSKTYFLNGNRFVDFGHITVQFEHHKGSSTLRVVEPAHDLDTVFDAVIDDKRLVQPMQQLVGTNSLSLWTAKLNLKRPRQGSGFGYHQDSPYWIYDCNHSVDNLPNVMILFDDATVQNGCLNVIRGSHTRGILRPNDDPSSEISSFFTHPEDFDEGDRVALEAPRGSLLFFDAHIVHGSQPNRSSEQRRALILTYQPGNYPALKSGQVRNVRTPRDPKCRL